MAAVPLFRYTNMAAVTSRENTLYIESTFDPPTQPPLKKKYPN